MKFSSTFADGMSGSIGGLTASHNRSGQYFRTKGLVTNPNTIRQQAVRSIFGTLVQYWTNTLTAAQRALWDDYAANTPLIDKIGNSINVTGQNMFVRSNSVRLQIGGSIIAAAPLIYNTGEPVTSITADTDSVPNTLGVTLAGTALDTSVAIAGEASDDGDICLYLGSTINPTRNYYKGPYQLAVAVTLPSGSAAELISTVLTSLLNSNGAPITGQTRGVRLRNMYDDGRLSQPYDAILPVLAATS